jgi:hypothetical protein
MRKPVAHVPGRGEVATRPVYSDRRPNTPILLDEAVLQRFLTALRAGASRDAAATFSGINPETMQRWLRIAAGKGKRHKPPYAPIQPGPEHVEFARLVREAEASVQVQVEANLTALTRKDFQAAKYVAEKKYPKVWGPEAEPEHDDRVQVQITGSNVLVISPDAVEGLVRARLDARRPSLLEDGDGDRRADPLRLLRSEG